MNKGNEGYLAVVLDVEAIVPNLDQVPMIREFPDVLTKELPEMPPNREIEFCINLAPSIQPVSNPTYYMAPAELRELKIQLQDMLDKGSSPKYIVVGCFGALCKEEGWVNVIMRGL